MAYVFLPVIFRQNCGSSIVSSSVHIRGPWSVKITAPKSIDIPPFMKQKPYDQSTLSTSKVNKLLMFFFSFVTRGIDLQVCRQPGLVCLFGTDRSIDRTYQNMCGKYINFDFVGAWMAGFVSLTMHMIYAQLLVLCRVTGFVILGDC